LTLLAVDVVGLDIGIIRVIGIIIVVIATALIDERSSPGDGGKHAAVDMSPR